MCTHIAQYTLCFLRLKFFFEIAQKHTVLQQDLKFQKMRKKEGRGTKKKSPPHTFSKTKYFHRISNLQNIRKMFVVYPKNFLLSQKNYLHTFMYTFVTPGNFSDFLRN